MSSFLQAHVHDIWNPVAYNQRPGAPFTNMDYCKISNISCTKSQNFYDSCFDLQLFLSHPLKSGVKSRMKMLLEQRLSALLQLHLCDQQLNWLLRPYIRDLTVPVIPPWISKHLSIKVWDEITYPFPNFSGATVEVWEWISNFIPHFIMDVITYPCWYPWLMYSLTFLVNSLAPGRFECNFRSEIFKLTVVIDGWGISGGIALRWMSLDYTDDKSILVQVMAWCRQATSHYLSQCWPRSMSPYGVTRPQWVKGAAGVTIYKMTLWNWS